MKFEIEANPKHESDQIAAFMVWLLGSGHHTTLIYTRRDMIDRDAPPTLDNFQHGTYHRTLVDRIVYDDGKKRTELYLKPINTRMIDTSPRA